MPDIHVSMLALHIPNVLPKTVPWIDYGPGGKGFYINHHSTWVRPAGRLIWSTLIFAIGIVIAYRLTKKPKRGRAVDLGPDNSRCDGRVGDDGPGVRHDPARVADVRELIPQLQHGDVRHARRTGSSTSTSRGRS